MSDAIAKDVALDDNQAAEKLDRELNRDRPREPSEREIAMKEIARKLNEEQGLEVDESAKLGEEDPEGEESYPEGEERAAKDQESDDPEVEASAEEDSVEESEPEPKATKDPLKELGYYENSDGELVTRMKINGVEREVKAEQVKAYLQKDLAGDWKLQQAAEKERQLNEMAASLRQARDDQIRQSLKPNQPPLGAEEAEQQARSVLEKIWDGDSDAAAKELAQLLQRGQSATVDEAAFLAKAEAAALSSIEKRELQRQQNEWNNSVDAGNAALQRDHPEIYADERLYDLVNSETARLVNAQQTGDPELINLTPADMITRAASTVQGWLDERSGPAPVSGTRGERKQNLKPTPRGMHTTPPRKPKNEIDTSPAAVIKRMAQARAVG